MISGNLCSDIIGTNPKYPPVVDHSWLNVDPSTYDNYPSDNNPVRILPKLADLWNHNPAQTGINLVPNANVMPLGVRASEEDCRSVDQIIKEAKKAAMLGLRGSSLSKHLRARFASKHIEMAKDELKKVADEIGLLGNVYIDASAFNSYDEAKQFLRQNSTRLARDLLLNTDGLNHNVISMLASDFHKNVVSSVSYDENLFKKYKAHLQDKGLPSDFVIDSKEALRMAFLYEPKAVVAEAPKKEKKFNEEEIQAQLKKESESQLSMALEAQDASIISKISPVVAFVQENLSKGRKTAAIKEMTRSKFVAEDIRRASEALAVTLSPEGLIDSNINGLISEGKISSVIGEELKKIGKKFPIKKEASFSEGVTVEKAVGVPGYFYSLGNVAPKDEYSSYRKASIEALKKGYSINAVRNKLLKKINASDVDLVLAEAVSGLNSVSSGSIANKFEAPKKVALVEDIAPKQTLPDESTIKPQIDEITEMFKSSGLELDLDDSHDYSTLEVGGLFNRDGLDQNL